MPFSKHTLFFFTIFLITLCSPVRSLDHDSQAINVRTWEDFKSSRPSEITDNCEEDEMRAYSLVADATSLSETNELCPAITKNCCGPIDQENIEALWEQDSLRMERYNQHNLKILRWVLGHGDNFHRLARIIADDYDALERDDDSRQEHENISLKTNQYCYNAAKEVLTKNFFHESSVEPFYHQINEKAEYLHNIRASFYCMLCSVDGQTAISTWKISDSFNEINYGTDFCKEIVNHTFQPTYMLYDNYNLLLSNVIKMLTCVFPGEEQELVEDSSSTSFKKPKEVDHDFESDQPPYDLDENEESLIENPLSMSDFGATITCDVGNDTAMWFTACEYYCQKFNIAKATPFYDYDATQLYALFTYLEQYEHAMPNGADVNLFNDDVISLKKEIHELHPKIPYLGIFFISKDDSIDISKYGSDFTRLGSYNPMQDSDGHLLEFHYESVSKLVSLAVIAFALLMK